MPNPVIDGFLPFTMVSIHPTIHKSTKLAIESQLARTLYKGGFCVNRSLIVLYTSMLWRILLDIKNSPNAENNMMIIMMKSLPFFVIFILIKFSQTLNRANKIAEKRTNAQKNRQKR